MTRTARRCPGVLSIALVSCLAAGGPARAVVYGADDRQDLYQETNPDVLDLTRSIAMLTTGALISPSVDGWTIDVTESYDSWAYGSLGEYLCHDEPYRDQPVPGFCSGFVVGQDLIATAGHCIESESDCSNTRFVFGFEMLDETTPVTHVAADDVYQCAEIVASSDEGATDYAIVRTDRPIVGHPALAIRREGAVEELPPGTPLLLIGHPVGLPMKVAGGSEVKDGYHDYFETDCDAFGGNSGSPVVNLDTMEVLGILVRGYPDHEYDSGGDCWRSAVCSEATGCDPPFGEGWEDVIRTAHFLSYVPPLLPDCGNGVCEPDESCWTCPDDCPGCLGDTLFSDDFALGLGLWGQSGPGEWTTGAGHEIYGYPPDGSGDPVASCSGCDPESRLETVQRFDLKPFAAVTLSFLRFVDPELDAGEHLALWAWDGGWQPVREWAGETGADDNNWHHVEVDLTRFANVTDFAFGFAARSDSPDEHVQIDDVRLIGFAPGVGSAGAVPEGPDAPGLPLIVQKGPGDEVTLSWAPSCIGTDDDYEIYEGLLGGYATHLGRLCSTGGATAVSLTPWNGSRYWLVVPRNFDAEGSAGVASGGTPRPPGDGICLPRDVAVCP